VTVQGHEFGTVAHELQAVLVDESAELKEAAVVIKFLFGKDGS
jgi:hypothetical protein